MSTAAMTSALSQGDLQAIAFVFICLFAMLFWIVSTLRTISDQLSGLHQQLNDWSQNLRYDQERLLGDIHSDLQEIIAENNRVAAQRRRYGYNP
jgi:hypothetical protein